MIRASDPLKLEQLVRGSGFRDLQVREIEFPTSRVPNEVANNNPAQPEDNTVGGVSETWEEMYINARDGYASDGRTIIPIPYHDVKVTEPSLLAKYTDQYRQHLAGTLPDEKFVDHRDVLKRDQKERADMGFAVRADESPQNILLLACNQCHNSKLDPEISRSKFNVDLDAMGENAIAEIDVAILRLKFGYSSERLIKEGIKFVDENGEPVELHKGEHLLTMPPRRLRDLTDEQIDSVIEFLRSEQQRLKK